MTQGAKFLKIVQLGRETTPGTAVAATTIWRGMGSLEQMDVHEFPEENIGILPGADREYKSQVGGQISLEAIPATFEQLCYLLEMGVGLVQTGAADGAGSDKIYTYTMPTTQGTLASTYTVEGGDNAGAEEMEYAYCPEFTLEGNAGEALMMSGVLQGRQISTATFTSPISLPSVEDVIFAKGKIYIDDADGTIGTTQFTNTWLNANISVKTGLTAVRTAEGFLYFSILKRIQPEITVNFTFEHNDNSIAEKLNWTNGTARLIRMIWEGSAVTTAGTTYTYKTLQIDMAGKWEKFDPIGDQDGNDIIPATFRARYNATSGLYAAFTVVNELTSLP